MAEYIDREALKQALLEKSFYPAIVKNVIENAPAADAVEVRHGVWIEEEVRVENYGCIDIEIFYKCSLCGRYEEMKELYCHCGAKMDGKDGTK